MPYQFAQERLDYSPFASGHVLHSLPGRTGFPARLASEILQRAAALLSTSGATGPYTLYDPCCGGAHLLTTLAYLHGDRLKRVVGSDIDVEAVDLAARNLALLTPRGLDARIATLADLHARFGKPSHAEALAHAGMLRARLMRHAAATPILTTTFVANATDAADILGHLAAHSINLIITDIPYGQEVAWRATAMPGAAAGEPSEQLLDALLPILATPSIVAVAANRQQNVAHPRYRRVAQLRLGKRQVVFLRADQRGDT